MYSNYLDRDLYPPSDAPFDPDAYFAEQRRKINTGKRKWLRIPRTDRFKHRLAEMWCKCHSGSGRHSKKVKSIINFLIARYWGTA